MQKYSSAITSINSSKLPSIFRKVDWVSGTKNLDYGGGKFDIATNWLEDHKGVRNYIYDPFNRTEEHNQEVLSKAPFDTITLSNVLNVIDDDDTRYQLLKRCKRLLKPCGLIYISVYEGDKSGIIKVNEKRNSCQLNRCLWQYIDEVVEVFGINVKIKNGMIIAWS